MTGGAVREILTSMLAVLALSGLIFGLIALSFFALIVMAIYAFWTFMMTFMPHLRDHAGRALLFGCMGLGSLMIVAMSSWLNASALAGSAAVEQHLAITLQSYTRDLDRAHSNALAAQDRKRARDRWATEREPRGERDRPVA